jgi:hypothetical protein
MLKCPVCDKEFYTKNSLANHIIKSSLVDHKDYYLKNFKKRICLKCGKSLDHRVKIYNGVCFTCFSSANIKKDVVKEFLTKICFKCKKEVTGYFSCMNTRVLCPECKEISDKAKKEYSKKFDTIRYKRQKECRSADKLSKKSSISEDLYLKLEADILDYSIPIHIILKKYNLSLKYFNLAAEELLTKEQLKDRKHQTRSTAAQKFAVIQKARWKADPSLKLNFTRNVPNKLEQKLIDDLKEKFVGSSIKNNIWKTIKDNNSGNLIRTEIDIRLEYCGVKFYILCDGEAFHGPDCYFRGNTVSSDDFLSRALFSLHPFVLRYSETEIKSGFAIGHIDKVLKEINSNDLKSYYRNWMIP